MLSCLTMSWCLNLPPPGGPDTRPDIPAGTNLILMAGYRAYRDAPVAPYVKIPFDPTNEANPACFKSKEGDWWGLEPTGDHVDVRWFGARMDNVTDDKFALEWTIKACLPNAYSGLRDLRVRTVFVPVGTLRVSGVAIMLRGVTIRGSGPQTSTIMFTTPNTLGIYMDGGAGLTPPSGLAGGGLQSISISLLDGLTGTHGVYMKGDAVDQPNECVFEDVRISTEPNAEWTTPFNINGADKTTGAAGIRFVSIRNLFLGNPAVYAFVAVGVIGLTINCAGAFGAPKSAQTPAAPLNFYIYGTTALKSNNVQLTNMNIQDTLWIYSCLSATVSGYIKNIAFCAEASASSFYGTLAGGSYYTAAATQQTPTLSPDSNRNVHYATRT